MKFGVTVHTVVCNEENWIWFALNSVRDSVDRILVYDTGSSDRTVEAIKAIDDPKIFFEEKGLVSGERLVALRQEQIDRTETAWIMLLDGDEIWDRRSLGEFLETMRKAQDTIWGVVVKTRNCVGDIYHVMPQSFGRYAIGGREGYLNLRGIRHRTNLRVVGTYPLEAYYPDNAIALQDQPKHLAFPDVAYWHLSHLSRSAQKPRLSGHRKIVYDRGIAVQKDIMIPEVFSIKHPEWIPSPLKHRSKSFLARAIVEGSLRRIKQLIVS